MSVHKAYRLHSYGGPETIHLDDVPIPTPGPSQALVAVSKVGINPFDWKVRGGALKDAHPLSLPIIMGNDFVGTIVAIGGTSSRLRVGDRVMAVTTRFGAYAEHIAVDESILARIPEKLDDLTAATLPMPALTAWQALETAGAIQSGMKVLIHGASGNVGAFAVQFAKARGAEVIGTASAKNREYVLELGADKFIDYQTENFEDIVKNVDIVLDFVLIGGSRNNTDRSWAVLNPTGVFVSAADPSVLFNTPEGRKGRFLQAREDAAALEQIAQQVVEGKIKPKVGRVFARDELLEAMEVSKTGGTAGRLIVDFKRV